MIFEDTEDTTIFEDTVDLRSKSAREGHPEMEEGDPEARLLDLRKAYPRVCKPALRGILKRHGLRGPFLDTIVDLHEPSEYKVGGREGKY